jgi:hypothetical protein
MKSTVGEPTGRLCQVKAPMRALMKWTRPYAERL